MDLIDLHIHSTASDGSMTPSELVKYAKSIGLKAIAITDHDTTDGLEEALNEGVRQNIEVIAGVEIGVDYSTEMHILGYFLNGDYSGIAPVLLDLRKRREERNPKMIAKLNELGIDITIEEVAELAKKAVMGRPHIAQVMVNKGYVASFEDAFRKYIGVNAPAYVKKDKLAPEEGIAKILESKGIPVLAHPIYLAHDFTQLDAVIKNLADKGLEGVEVYYTDNSESQTMETLKIAQKYNLLITGGSDFHGSYKPEIEMGVGLGNLSIPYELLEAMKRRIT